MDQNNPLSGRVLVKYFETNSMSFGGRWPGTQEKGHRPPLQFSLYGRSVTDPPYNFHCMVGRSPTSQMARSLNFFMACNLPYHTVLLMKAVWYSHSRNGLRSSFTNTLPDNVNPLVWKNRDGEISPVVTQAHFIFPSHGLAVMVKINFPSRGSAAPGEIYLHQSC